VLEFGGRNINGTVRVLFDPVATYTSIDLMPGPGVDHLGDAVSYVPEVKPDTIICTEVLEHTPNWPLIIRNAARILDKDGVLILTCATDPRQPHSMVDGLPLHLKWNNNGTNPEYYKNIDPMQLGSVVDSAGFEWDLEVDEQAGDLRLLARKE
jgi:hypothetical protein